MVTCSTASVRGLWSRLAGLLLRCLHRLAELDIRLSGAKCRLSSSSSAISAPVPPSRASPPLAPCGPAPCVLMVVAQSLQHTSRGLATAPQGPCVCVVVLRRSVRFTARHTSPTALASRSSSGSSARAHLPLHASESSRDLHAPAATPPACVRAPGVPEWISSSMHRQWAALLSRSLPPTS